MQLSLFTPDTPTRREFEPYTNHYPFLTVKPGDYAVITCPELPEIGYSYQQRIRVLAVDGDNVRGVFFAPWAEHYLDGIEITVTKQIIREQPDYYANSKR